MEHTFEVTINFCKNQTWQGIVRTDKGDRPFYSELELLLEMARLTCQEEPELQNSRI